MSGKEFESGILSAIASCSTYSDKKTVKPIPTLSPLSHGSKNENNVIRHNIRVGAEKQVYLLVMQNDT